MKKNVGQTDAVLRFMLGLAFIVNIWAAETGVVGTIILLILGSVMIFTAWSGFCILYKPLGICTVEDCKCCSEDKAEASE